MAARASSHTRDLDAVRPSLSSEAAKDHKAPAGLTSHCAAICAAKAVTTVFKHRLSLSFLEAMRGLPQYAYTANRSTQEGIARVAAHCSMVRDLVKTQTLTVFDRYAGAKYTPCLGGAQLSIDLSKAFDLLPRQTLQTLLADTDLSPDEQQILLEWHQAGQYRIQGRGSEKSVYVRLDCGVRQGCVLSPSLWGLFTKCIQQRLDAANGAGWTAQRGTMFADDLRFQWVFHTECELSRVRAEVLAIFRTLRDLGMKANPEKSKFLISARGQQARKWIKRWIRKTRKANGSFTLEVARRIEYPLLLSSRISGPFSRIGTLSWRRLDTGWGWPQVIVTDSGKSCMHAGCLVWATGSGCGGSWFRPRSSMLLRPWASLPKWPNCFMFKQCDTSGLSSAQPGT